MNEINRTVYVIVDGGVVVDVRSNDPDIEVEILDLDGVDDIELAYEITMRVEEVDNYPLVRWWHFKR